MSPFQALGWALVHSIWQLALVGLGAALLMRATPSVRARYLVVMASLGLCLALPLATFLGSLTSVVGAGHPGASFSLVAQGAAETAAPAAKASLAATALRVLAARVTLLAGLWGLGVAVMLVRFTGGLALTGRWRRASGPAPGAWEGRFRALAARMGCPARVALRAATGLATPVALGLVRPVVLVPAALFTALPEPLLEALLAHELAHLARWDYLASLLQGAVEVLVFHHPVVWWLSRRARDLRELLADDFAAEALGEPRRLALALDALDDLKSRPALLALSAHGGSLRTRIQRLLTPRAPGGAPWMAAPVLALLLPCAALVLRAEIPSGAPISVNAEKVATLDRLAREEGVDPQLLRSVAWVESGCSYRTSPAGATGLLQVTPGTARRFGVVDPADQNQVDRAGARYLKHLLDQYHGDVAQAVTAYTCGEEAPEAARKAAQGYASLVLDVLKARAVQPEAPLAPGSAEGVLRRMEDGTWMMDARLCSSGRDMELELLGDEGDGHTKSYAKIMCGGGGKDPAPAWSESHPRIRTQVIPEGTKLRLRYSLPSLGRSGETVVLIDAPWKTFSLRTSPSSPEGR